MWNQGCVRIYLPASHETTLLAVFWWLNVFLSSVCNGCRYHLRLIASFQFQKTWIGSQNMVHLFDRTTTLQSFDVFILIFFNSASNCVKNSRTARRNIKRSTFFSGSLRFWVSYSLNKFFVIKWIFVILLYLEPQI